MKSPKEILTKELELAETVVINLRHVIRKTEEALAAHKKDEKEAEERYRVFKAALATLERKL